MNQLDEVKQIKMLLKQKRRLVKEKSKVIKINKRLQHEGKLTITDVEYVESLDYDINGINDDLRELGYK